MRIREALDALGVKAKWTEAALDEAACLGLPECPSPTIFVDGVAVGGLSPPRRVCTEECGFAASRRSVPWYRSSNAP